MLAGAFGKIKLTFTVALTETCSVKDRPRPSSRDSPARYKMVMLAPVRHHPWTCRSLRSVISN
jgi:hypothetical protein